MLRIAYRALIVLFCTVMGVSLIAARPLPSSPLVANSPAREDRSLNPRPAAGVRMLGTARAAAPLSASGERSARMRYRAATQLAPTTLPPAGPPIAPPLTHITGDGPWMRGTFITQTERLDLYIGSESFSAEQVAALAPLLEQLLREAEARFGTQLPYRVSVGFYGPAAAPSRGVRGMAYTAERRAELFYLPYESTERAATIVTHELGHHLEVARYGEVVQRRADTILHEGLATWIAGDRWLSMCGAASWKERAQRLHAAGIPRRLVTAEESGANNAYELWASFVDFLIERYGWEQFDELYRSGRGRAPGSANYQAITGKSLDELAEEWRAWLDAPLPSETGSKSLEQHRVSSEPVLDEIQD